MVADFRTNSLIVSAGPRDMTEIAALVARIDAPSGAAVDQVRVFPLRNAIASELAEVLRNAIQSQAVPGAPLDGDRHIWWNLVSSSPERIERAKADWQGERFARVPGETERIPLPES